MIQRRNINELVEVNFKFWLLMMLATTIGEIIGNFISRDLALGYILGSIILVSAFFISVLVTLFIDKIHPLMFWILIVLGNIAGTDVADFITRDMNLGNYYGSSMVLTILIILLSTIIAIRQFIRDGTTKYRLIEIFYWLAILTSSTFGTTCGDYFSSDTGLGSAGSTVLLLSVLSALGLLVIKFKFSKSFGYWIAIVIVHPIGATFGNYISKPEGLNLGNIITGFVLICLFGTYLYFPKKE